MPSPSELFSTGPKIRMELMPGTFPSLPFHSLLAPCSRHPKMPGAPLTKTTPISAGLLDPGLGACGS